MSGERSGRTGTRARVALLAGVSAARIWMVPTKLLVPGAFKWRGRDPKRFPLTVLADLTDGFNGSELEEAVISGLYEAFYAGRDLSEKDLVAAIKDTVPLSVTMKEKVEAIREWGRARARPAAGPVRQKGGLRKAQLN